ncbi:MAG: Fic family protein [Crocinitomicaceae bacterium]|nr:Fic family protein [Crocinitomicaceae bacterium]
MEWKKYPYEFEGLAVSLARIEEKKTKLDALRPIPTSVLEKIKQSSSIEWTYNSNSIEGNTLTLQETKMVIEEGFTIKGKSLREHFEAVNHQNAIDYVEQLVSPNYTLSARDILDVHALVLNNIEKEFAGRYRGHGVRIAGASFIPPNALKVNDLMDDLIHWMNTEASQLSPIVAVAIFHHRFVWIHPFLDGNGRTVRLIFNLLLMRLGYPPAIILRNDRKKYYDALNKANKGDYSKIVLVVLQALERSVDIYLSSFTNTYEDYQPISDIVSEPEFPYGQEYVSLLARQGKIDAFKEGRNWLTSKKAVEDYVRNRKRKR